MRTGGAPRPPRLRVSRLFQRVLARCGERTAPSVPAELSGIPGLTENQRSLTPLNIELFAPSPVRSPLPDCWLQFTTDYSREPLVLSASSIRSDIVHAMSTWVVLRNGARWSGKNAGTRYGGNGW